MTRLTWTPGVKLCISDKQLNLIKFIFVFTLTEKNWVSCTLSTFFRNQLHVPGFGRDIARYNSINLVIV